MKQIFFSIICAIIVKCSVFAQANVKRITNLQDSYPVISPDGNKIVFQSNRNGNWQVYVSTRNGRNVTQLTHTDSVNTNPIWSPDGKQICFVSTRDGNTEVYTMNADGSSQKRLTNFPGDDSHPHWSPDGKRIIFNSARTTPDISIPWINQVHEIFVMDADGSNSRQISSFKTISTNPHYSPDGKKIVFRHFINTPAITWSGNPSRGNSEIFVMNADGTMPVNLSNSAGYDSWPWWSPDGNYVVFSSNRENVMNVGQLYVADVKGNNCRKITSGPASHVRPSWGPDINTVILQQVWGNNESGGNLMLLDINDSVWSLIKSPVSFSRITNQRLTNEGKLSRGISAADYNQDNWDDITIANADMQGNSLFQNKKGVFQKQFSNSVVEAVSSSESIYWVDIDNDGDLDLFVTNSRKNQNFLFKNDSNKTFIQITGDELTRNAGGHHGCAWSDIDKDGDLDVFVTTRDNEDDLMFINDGKGNFKQVDGPWKGNGGDGRSCAFADVNNDGWPDLYVGNYGGTNQQGQREKQRNFFYLNKGKMQFEEIRTGDFVTIKSLTYGVSFIDYDNDGDADLLVTNAARTDNNFLYNNDGLGNFTNVINAVTTETFHPSKGHTWADFDNDGYLDVFIVTGTENVPAPVLHNLMYLNKGSNQFEKVKFQPQVSQPDVSAGTAWLDYDNDGDQDIFVANWGANDENEELYRNEGNLNKWTDIQLKCIRNNKFGIGTKVTIQYKDQGMVKKQHQWMHTNTGYASQNPYRMHFGLGNANSIDLIEIVWPDGSKQTHKQLPVNTRIVLTEDTTPVFLPII